MKAESCSGYRRLVAEPFGPLIGKRRELGIDRGSELLHDLRAADK